MIKTQEIISRLSRSQKRLSKSHRKIAQLIETHYDKAVYMTAQKMGKIVGVSESTVVRFAVALGYEGYPQMQKALQEIVRHRLTTSQRFAMAADISEDELLDTVLKTDIDNIKATIGQLDRDVFRQALAAEGCPAATGYPYVLNELPLLGGPLRERDRDRFFGRRIDYAAETYPVARDLVDNVMMNYSQHWLLSDPETVRDIGRAVQKVVDSIDTLRNREPA